MGSFKNISINSFRNFESLSLKFSNNCNVFFGDNGSGKTNLLEAISLFSKGRGLKNEKLFNIIKRDKDKFIIKSDFENEGIIYKLVSETKILNLQQRKILFVNNDKSIEILNKIYSVAPFLFFLPETERLFVSSPSTRRNFIDRFIFSHKIAYNKVINQYNKNLTERSKLLKLSNFDNDWLNKIENNISILGLEIYHSRKQQLESIVSYLNEFLKDFNQFYSINIKINDSFFIDEINQDYFASMLKNNRKQDAILGGSKIGPHKSDYLFEVNNEYTASQLSTGQQKTIILLLYLSQCKYLVDLGIKPILLLDEVCSHLDETNRKILLALVETFDLQIFMTGTTKSLFSFLSTNTNFCNIVDL